MWMHAVFEKGINESRCCNRFYRKCTHTHTSEREKKGEWKMARQRIRVLRLLNSQRLIIITIFGISWNAFTIVTMLPEWIFYFGGFRFLWIVEPDANLRTPTHAKKIFNSVCTARHTIKNCFNLTASPFVACASRSLLASIPFASMFIFRSLKSSSKQWETESNFQQSSSPFLSILCNDQYCECC